MWHILDDSWVFPAGKSKFRRRINVEISTSKKRWKRKNISTSKVPAGFFCMILWMVYMYSVNRNRIEMRIVWYVI